MKCTSLKIVNLNIAEDFYDYKGVFRLCTEKECVDCDLTDLENDSKISEIKNHFELEEEIDEISKIIKEKVMEAAKIESRIVEGKPCSEEVDDMEKEMRIKSLDLS